MSTNIKSVLEEYGIDLKLCTLDELVRGVEFIDTIQQLDINVLEDLKNLLGGLKQDGDLISSTHMHDLMKFNLASKVVHMGQEGWNAATVLGKRAIRVAVALGKIKS